MAGSSFRPSYDGIGDMLCMPEIAQHLLERANAVMAAAIAASPYDPNATDGSHYKDAFSTKVGIRQRRTRRAVATVTNTDPAAPYIEFGTSKTHAHHVLARALDAARR